MRSVQPEVFIVADTALNSQQVAAYLRRVVVDCHANEFGKVDEDVRQQSIASDQEFAITEVQENLSQSSDSEALTALMGRMCYRSFAPGLNPNVSRTRTGIVPYLGHIFESGHGSVLEHATVSVIFYNVSRVFTHELVRHRVGTAMSQESLRFVRLDDLGLWLPPEIECDSELTELFHTTFENMEQLQLALAAKTKINDVKNFDHKKRLTSAFRRVAPDGLATTIGFTANMRAWRHILRMRGDLSAEAEMRCVMFDVARQFQTRYRAMFSDMFFMPVNAPKRLEEDRLRVESLPPDANWQDYYIDFEHRKV